jgi:hypothetical protein
MITWFTKVMALAFKKDLHGNAPTPKLAMGLQHADLTSYKDIAS